MRTKAERRARDHKALQKAIKVARSQASITTSEEVVQKRARKIRDHLKYCSCQMCRNPRTSKLYKGSQKKTIQELRITITNE